MKNRTHGTLAGFDGSEPPRPSSWPSPPEHPGLERGETHIWRADINQNPDFLSSCLRILDPDETARARRFHFQKDRRRFVIARGILRFILSRYLDVEPERVEICYGPYGKPALAGAHGGSRLCFNLSHSHSLILYAFTREREIGVDLEYVREELAAASIAELVFSRGEIENILKASPARRAEIFFHYWTRKEAFVKAVGKGLSISLDQFEVPVESPALLIESDRNGRRWTLHGLLPGPGYVGAIAVEGVSRRLSFWQWPEGGT